MTRREEIEQQAINSYPDCPERGFGTGDYEYPEFHDNEREAFIEGAKWADKTMIERLRELKCGYEKDLDAEPRIYERDIQLCVKISLIERLIIELKEE